MEMGFIDLFVYVMHFVQNLIRPRVILGIYFFINCLVDSVRLFSLKCLLCSFF